MESDWELTKEEAKIAVLCRDFASREISPYVKALETDLPFRLQLFSKMAELGLFTLGISEQKEGVKNILGYLFCLKEISKADAGIGVAMAVTHMVAEAIQTYGTNEQKEKYLSNGKGGCRYPFSFALTESQAGSDVKSIETKVKEDPEDPNYLLLSGKKQFITNADIAGAIVVMAKDDRDGQSGISAFIVDKGSSGLSFTKKEDKLGLLTANLVSFSFEKCRIPKESLLGSIGMGLNIALSSLDSGRLGIASQSLGIAEAAFEAALAFAKNREQFGHPIVENQAIAFKLADMHVKLSACLGLILKAARQKNRGLKHTLAAAEAKLFCSEACNEIAGDALQIHGGYGYVKDYPIEKYFRDARVTTLYEGTSEIQRLVISRHLLSS